MKPASTLICQTALLMTLLARRKSDSRLLMEEKATFTLMLIVFDDGSKMPPLFIFKSKYSIPEALKKKI